MIERGPGGFLLLCGKLSSASKQAKEGAGCFFFRVGRVELALKKRKRALAASSAVWKRRTSTKQAKEGVGGFLCSVGSVDLALNKRKRSSVASSVVLEA